MWIPKVRASRLDVLAEALGASVDWTCEKRPSEKYHETLVNPNEALRTHDLGDYYAIEAGQQPWTDERRPRSTVVKLGPQDDGRLGFSYTSLNAKQYTAEELREVLKDV